MRNDEITNDTRRPGPTKVEQSAAPEEARLLSRRHFLACAGAIGVSTWLGVRRSMPAITAHADVPASWNGPVELIRKAAAVDPITVQTLRGNLSVLIGNGGNIVVLPGPDGVLLSDAGIVGPKVAASVATITKTPIRHLVNTHWHFDHTDANEWHHAHGAAIVAQERTRAHLATTTRVKDWDFTFPAAPAGAIPATVFADDHELRLNGSLVQLKHYPPAHTDSDVSVHFTDADVLHVADTWWNGIYPFVDASTGGSIDGMIRATDRNLAKATRTTVIVPGHGPVGDRAALERWRDMLVTVRDRVAALKKKGQPLAAVVAAKPTASFDATYGRGIIGPDFFTRIVYEQV